MLYSFIGPTRLPTHYYVIVMTSSLVTISYKSLYLTFLSSFPWHFTSFHKLTTLIIHNSLVLSLPAQNVPFSQILTTLSLTGLTSQNLSRLPFLLNMFFTCFAEVFLYSTVND